MVSPVFKLPLYWGYYSLHRLSPKRPCSSLLYLLELHRPETTGPGYQLHRFSELFDLQPLCNFHCRCLGPKISLYSTTCLLWPLLDHLFFSLPPFKKRWYSFSPPQHCCLRTRTRLVPFFFLFWYYQKLPLNLFR